MRLSHSLIAFLALFPCSLAAAEEQSGACSADATHLCFQANRFGATLTYEPSALSATAVQPNGAVAGYFRFADPLAAELWLDLLDGCSLNSQYWVSALGVSNLGWTLTVTDHLLGSTQTYSAPIGSFVDPIIDINAFNCSARQTEPGREPQSLLATSMDLGGGRFRVTATLPSIAAQTQKLTRNSGLLSFFTPTRPNILVKVVYPGDPGFFGIAASISTTDSTTLQITDLCNGSVQTYNTSISTTFGDSQAFLVDDPSCGLFSDSFESADTTAWSLTLP